LHAADRTTDAILYVTATMLGLTDNQNGLGLAETAPEQVPATSSEYVLSCMIGPSRLDRNVARIMWEDIRSGEAVANGKAIGAMCRTFETTNPLDTYPAVRGIAAISPTAAILMGSNTGVMEGYRLHEHTQAVLGRFDDLYKGQFSAEECKLIRTALGLQDMAKPLSYAINGPSELQGVYNTMTIEAMLRYTQDLTADEKRLITLCASHDFIGLMLRGHISIGEAKAGLDGIRRSCPPQYRDRLDAYMQAIYFSDATAYTSNATYKTPDGNTHSCAPVLNYLFQPDDQGPGFKEPFQQRLFDMLWES